MTQLTFFPMVAALRKSNCFHSTSKKYGFTLKTEFEKCIDEKENFSIFSRYIIATDR